MPAPPSDHLYTKINASTGWFVGIVAALAMVAITVLVFSPNPARASDIAGIAGATYVLHEDGDAICTAQAVDTDDGLLILTANHCVDNRSAAFSVNLVTFDEAKFDKKVAETAYFLDVVRRDAKTDIAVLRPIDKSIDLDTVDLATVDEADAALSTGVPVLVAGFPGTDTAPMGDLLITDGRYVGLSKSYAPGTDGPLYRTTVSVHYGNSGGGLYVQVGDSWKLVGITSQLDPERKWVGSLFGTRDAIEKNIRLTPKPATDK